jgi:hypothetical protein
MNSYQTDVKPDLPQAEVASAPGQAAYGARVLSPEEIEVVAGGPEGTVGSGMNPP